MVAAGGAKLCLPNVCALPSIGTELDVCGLLGSLSGEPGPAVISGSDDKQEITMKTLHLAAIRCSLMFLVTVLAWAGIADAQSFPRLKPLPPKKHATVLNATRALAATTSPWQLLTNQPPVLDPVDCGPGNPILLTDGSVML